MSIVPEMYRRNVRSVESAASSFDGSSASKGKDVVAPAADKLVADVSIPTLNLSCHVPVTSAKLRSPGRALAGLSALAAPGSGRSKSGSDGSKPGSHRSVGSRPASPNYSPTMDFDTGKPLSQSELGRTNRRRHTLATFKKVGSFSRTQSSGMPKHPTKAPQRPIAPPKSPMSYNESSPESKDGSKDDKIFRSATFTSPKEARDKAEATSSNSSAFRGSSKSLSSSSGGKLNRRIHLDDPSFAAREKRVIPKSPQGDPLLKSGQLERRMSSKSLDKRFLSLLKTDSTGGSPKEHGPKNESPLGLSPCLAEDETAEDETDSASPIFDGSPSSSSTSPPLFEQRRRSRFLIGPLRLPTGLIASESSPIISDDVYEDMPIGYRWQKDGFVSVSCPKCRMGFDESGPRFLMCGHSFCYPCLDIEDGKIECPTCHQVEDKKDIQFNYALASIKPLPLQSILERDDSDLIEAMEAICPICMENFSFNTPLLMACGHSICERCVPMIQCKEEVDMMECPECRLRSPRWKLIQNKGLQQALSTVHQVKEYFSPRSSQYSLSASVSPTVVGPSSIA